MNEMQLEKTAQELGAEVKRVKFGYWDCQALVKGDLTLCLAMSVIFEKDNSNSAITNISKLPRKINSEIIKKLFLTLTNDNEYTSIKNLGNIYI